MIKDETLTLSLRLIESLAGSARKDPARTGSESYQPIRSGLSEECTI